MRRAMSLSLLSLMVLLRTAAVRLAPRYDGGGICVAAEESIGPGIVISSASSTDWTPE